MVVFWYLSRAPAQLWTKLWRNYRANYTLAHSMAGIVWIFRINLTSARTFFRDDLIFCVHNEPTHFVSQLRFDRHPVITSIITNHNFIKWWGTWTRDNSKKYSLRISQVKTNALWWNLVGEGGSFYPALILISTNPLRECMAHYFVIVSVLIDEPDEQERQWKSQLNTKQVKKWIGNRKREHAHGNAIEKPFSWLFALASVRFKYTHFVIALY